MQFLIKALDRGYLAAAGILKKFQDLDVSRIMLTHSAKCAWLVFAHLLSILHLELKEGPRKR
jgi:hypothetical protein